jgi:hypothetical protein
VKIEVRVKTGSKHPGIDRIDDRHFVVAIRERPVEGKANQAVVQAMSDFFDIPKTSIAIVTGQKSKNKILEII